MEKILDSIFVLSTLRTLSKAQSRVFGFAEHHFQVNQPLKPPEVLQFEEKYQVQLPGDYRTFLLEVGNGGAGPGYGVFPLGRMDGKGRNLEPWQEGAGIVGSLRKPFPYQEAWNDDSGMPSEELFEKNEDEYDRLAAVFEEKYWDSSHVNGAIPISHLGCALRVWLVVSGNEAGNLWRDGRSENTGLRPMASKNRRRTCFASWYLEWLEECLQSLSQPGI